jgi:hypothetical protein
MAPGMRKCVDCQRWISLEYLSTHGCVKHVGNLEEKIDYIRQVFIGLQGQEIALPLGGYSLIFDLLEDITDDYLLLKIQMGD